MPPMQAGVRPGQRLLTVSDPINMGEDLEVSHTVLHPWARLLCKSTTCHLAFDRGLKAVRLAKAHTWVCLRDGSIAFRSKL